jgi:CPA1 family monovalent cation:H+ antiporter
MHNDLFLVLFLLFIVLMLVMLGQKLRISYPIFLVVAGLGMGFVPGIPQVSIDPELIFMIFLPPLLYEAAWYTSWKDFWHWRRPIGMLAFGLVFVTSLVVAGVSYWVIPGFTLALGFLLGGIISPPDAVAATSVLKNIKVPKRVMSILEGESLVNDASSLIVFRFALAAVVSGTFEWHDAVLQFFLSAGMGIVVGLAVAYVMYAVHRFLPTTPSINATLTLMTPYFMYLIAEQFHFSGVMAVVTGGLFLSYRSHEILRNGSTRMQTTGVWSTVTFVLNALVFILIGLELPEILSGLNDYSVPEAIGYGLLISAVAIVVRLLWTYPIAYVPIWFHNTVRADRANPTWKGPTIIGWAGMRGVVSLASALSIPLTLTNGQEFPHRNLILCITFVVILVTLVFQGLTLPLVIKWVDIKEMDEFPSEDEQEANIQLRLKEAVIKRLDGQFAADLAGNQLIALLRKNVEQDMASIREHLNCLDCNISEEAAVDRYNEVFRHMMAVKRTELFHMRQEKAFQDEVIRKQEALLDIDEARIDNQRRGHV